MSINVDYRDFKIKDDVNPAELKKLMARDMSWGTFVENLSAAEATCEEGASTRWKATEPNITNVPNGRADDQQFTLSFPDDNFNFERESVDHFVGVVAGDAILNPNLASLEVDDFEFTTDLLYANFPGPSVGIDGIYEDLLQPTLNGAHRPIVAFTIKPRLGLNVDDIARIFEAAAVSGIDIVEDDERLIDPASCPFPDRVKAISKIQEQYAALYSVNITADSQGALKKLDFCADNGIRMVKLDVLVCGFETLRKVAWHVQQHHGSRIAITVYPDAYRAYRRLSRKFILKLSRLCGADIIYAGSPNWARYEKETGKLQETIEPIYQNHRMLAAEIDRGKHVKGTLATITNDQHLSRSELIMTYFRKHKDGHYKYGFFIGGGISGFPSDISGSVSQWMQCVNYASSQDLSDYVPYDLSDFEDGFRRIGWDHLNVLEGLK